MSRSPVTRLGPSPFYVARLSTRAELGEKRDAAIEGFPTMPTLSHSSESVTDGPL